MAKRVQSIEQLKRELSEREAELADLQRKRATVEKVLIAIDEQIAALTGEATKRRGRKPAKRGRGKAEGTEASPYTGKGVRSLRKKLKLSQEAFGKLVGVSSLTVYQWEKKPGQLNLRKATAEKLAKVWNAEPSEVQMNVEETKREKKPVKKTAKKKAQKKEQPQE